MSKKTNEHITFEVALSEDPATGELLLPLPDELLSQVGWKEGDDLEWAVTDSGQIVLKKKS
jgi:hypothetical protein